MTARVRHAREQLVLVVVRHDGGGLWVRDFGVVAAEHEQALAVRRQHYRVRAVFATALETPEGFDFVQLIVAIRVGHTVESGAGFAAVETDVERVERPLEPVRAEMSAGIFSTSGSPAPRVMRKMPCPPWSPQ